MIPALDFHITDHTAPLSVVMRLGTGCNHFFIFLNVEPGIPGSGKVDGVLTLEPQWD